MPRDGEPVLKLGHSGVLSDSDASQVNLGGAVHVVRDPHHHRH
jgi:hypothetical protein